MRSQRVLIVEDDVEVLERLACLVIEQHDFELVGAEANFEAGHRALLKEKPDILLTDIGLPDGSGIELIREISRKGFDTEAMVISGFQDEHTVFQALEAGAKSYILKHDEGQAISDAMRSMVNGGAPISPVIARLMLQRFQTQAANVKEHQAEPLPEKLTERQVMILKLVSQGFSSREISEKLDITYFTVTTHIKNIYNKLQVNSRTEALHEALKLGLI